MPALIGGPLSGYLVGTRGPRGVLVGGMLALAGGVGLAGAAWPSTRRSAGCSRRISSIGIGYAVLSAPVSTVAVSSMPREQAGVAAGLASSARNVGIVLGIAVLGAIVNGRVPVVLTPGSGATGAAFDAFQVEYVDALHIAYAVGGRRRADRRRRRGPDDASDAARRERERRRHRSSRQATCSCAICSCGMRPPEGTA